MDKIKQLGQVMTPENIVNHMIDVLCLSNEEIKTKLFLDNSCGNGNFIKALINIGVPATHIYACDIDEEISKSITKLIPLNNFYLGSAFNKTDWFNKFDYVIGNPPYVRIHNIDPTLKNFLKSNYSSCTGMFDLYYGFYELGLKFLNDTGTLLYITPNSFIKNASGKNLREIIENKINLWYFEDFEHQNNFENYSTYTCIVGLSKIKTKIPIPWNKTRNKIGLCFSSLQNGIATLADKIFIQNDFSFLESDLIHPILKASTGEEKYVIVPPKSEEELMRFPKTYGYLLSNKNKLIARAITGKTQWFEFGRSQGLVNMNKEKIAIPTTVSFDGLKLYRLPKDYYVYSGLYATANNLDQLENELRDENLLNYLIENGKPMQGNYVQISSTLLKNY